MTGPDGRVTPSLSEPYAGPDHDRPRGAEIDGADAADRGEILAVGLVDLVEDIVAVDAERVAAVGRLPDHPRIEQRIAALEQAIHPRRRPDRTVDIGVVDGERGQRAIAHLRAPGHEADIAEIGL